MVVEADVEGRDALIGGGEAVFFWIAWRQASRSNACRISDMVWQPQHQNGPAAGFPAS